MKITLESTDDFVKLNELPARVWKGHTEGGIEIFAFIHLIAVEPGPDSEAFDRELLAQPDPIMVPEDKITH